MAGKGCLQIWQRNSSKIKLYFKGFIRFQKINYNSALATADCVLSAVNGLLQVLVCTYLFLNMFEQLLKGY